MQCSELVCEITLNQMNEKPKQKKRDECQGADDFQSTRRLHHEMARDVPIGTGRRRRRYVTADSRAQKLSGTVGAVRSRWSGHDVVESCGILSRRGTRGKLESVRHSSDRGFSKIV